MNFKALSQQYEQEYLEKTSELLKIPSIYEQDDDYPYGRPISEALDKMLDIAECDGFSVKNVDGHGGHVEFGEGDEIIGILGHLDVVPAGEGWTTPPFEPTIRNGILYARGAQDDKGPVMAAYIAMKLLKEQGFKPQKKIRLILGTDEERDWKGIEYYFKHELMPSVGFTPDASFPVIHAEKGLLDSYITYGVPFESGSTHICEIHGGDRLNMVPDNARALVRSKERIVADFQQYLKENNLSGHIEEEGNEYKLTVNGVAVHASTPEEGRNAITGMLGFLRTLPLSQPEKLWIQSIYNDFSKSNGEGLGLKMADEISGPLTANLGSITLMEGTCKLGFNLRYPVTTKYEEIIECLNKAAHKNGGKLEIYDHLPSTHLPKDHPFVETLLSVYNKVTGDAATAQSMGGATYARSLHAGVAFGALFDDSPNTAHQRDEHVRISDMIKAIEIYAESIYELTK